MSERLLSEQSGEPSCATSLLAPDGGGAVGAERVIGVAARRPQFAVKAGAGADTADTACPFLNGRSGEKGRRLETERGERRFDIDSFHTFFFVWRCVIIANLLRCYRIRACILAILTHLLYTLLYMRTKFALYLIIYGILRQFISQPLCDRRRCRCRRAVRGGFRWRALVCEGVVRRWYRHRRVCRSHPLRRR